MQESCIIEREKTFITRGDGRESEDYKSKPKEDSLMSLKSLFYYCNVMSAGNDLFQSRSESCVN